jgi:hypothetical protein
MSRRDSLEGKMLSPAYVCGFFALAGYEVQTNIGLFCVFYSCELAGMSPSILGG